MAIQDVFRAISSLTWKPAVLFFYQINVITKTVPSVASPPVLRVYPGLPPREQPTSYTRRDSGNSAMVRLRLRKCTRDYEVPRETNNGVLQYIHSGGSLFFLKASLSVFFLLSAKLNRTP